MNGMEIRNGDCLELLRAMEDNSVDSIVTDPPYGLSQCKPKHIAEALGCWLAGEPYEPKGKGFMGKSWDAFVPGPEVWRECLRVLKPGGHMAVFAGSRTVDLMGIAVRLAGFEIRDQLQWIYGSGFPKSLDVSKAIDKAAGAEREVIGTRKLQGKARVLKGGNYTGDYDRVETDSINLTAPATDAAKQWQGYGTAIKPAHEPIILARKPLDGTVANNVLTHGVGGLNVDGCRVEGKLEGDPNRFAKTDGGSFNDVSKRAPVVRTEGRWPANVILDEDAGALLDTVHHVESGCALTDAIRRATNESVGPSRFFYCAKASKKEREAGLEHLELQRRTDGREGDCDNPRLRTSERRNTHPTVKPLALMQWLCRLVTPIRPGLILDPFAGSGSTGCAAKKEGFGFIGLELSSEYCEIARARISAV